MKFIKQSINLRIRVNYPNLTWILINRQKRNLNSSKIEKDNNTTKKKI
jgi:hypothetical protein